MDDFDAFWSAYPRRQAKADARKAWMQTAPIRPAIDVIIASIAAQMELWRESEPKYIPLPATWLRGERWDDVTVIDLPAPARKPDRYDLANQEFEQRYGGLRSVK